MLLEIQCNNHNQSVLACKAGFNEVYFFVYVGVEQLAVKYGLSPKRESKEPKHIRKLRLKR
jgi:hypothetical protein